MTPYTVWHACPVPAAAAVAWEPWRPIAGHLAHPLIAKLPAGDAHQIARSMRSVFPGHLFAVRPTATGYPVWPVAMVDHYDMPPYSDAEA
jgi:hypothetical protein